jgi:hypothetical protein
MFDPFKDFETEGYLFDVRNAVLRLQRRLTQPSQMLAHSYVFAGIHPGKPTFPIGSRVH